MRDSVARSRGFLPLSLAVLVAAAVSSVYSGQQPPRASTQQPPRASTQQSTQDGLLLLRKMQDALGGAGSIVAVRDYEETIRAEAWDAAGTALGDVRKRTRWMRTPGLLRLDQIGPRGTYVLYFDGGSRSGWEILPDMTSADRYKTSGTPIELTGGELEFATNYLSGFELTLWLADQMPGYTVTSPGPNVIRIEHGRAATDFTLDPVSGLPRSSAGVSLADPDRPVPGEMRYEAWQEVSSVRFPTHRINFLSGMKRGEVTTSAIRINVGLRPQDLAAKPADFVPDISRR